MSVRVIYCKSGIVVDDVLNARYENLTYKIKTHAHY